MIKDNIYICDYCGKDSGEFDEETGNHPNCNLIADLREAYYVEWRRADKLNQCQSIIATINGEPVRCEHPATREAITGRSFVRVCDRCFECFYCTEKSLEK